jgi:hypothetical protein
MRRCKAFLHAHRKTVRWTVFCLALVLFFFVLGRLGTPRVGAGFCRVYF